MTIDTLNKVQDTEALVNDKRKEQLLSSEVEHIDITSFDARPIVEAIQAAPFLSEEQRADIFYRNAERFLARPRP